MSTNSLPNLKVLPLGGAGAVHDIQQLEALRQFQFDTSLLDDAIITQRFLDRYQQWILSSRNNRLTNIEKFPYACYTNATTEAFDKFYLRNNKRRFRCFRAEYMYHILSWRNCFPDWKYLEDEPLATNDAIVLSYPFADTGNKHPRMDEIMARATELGIPVLLDMAYFGICAGLEFDLSWPCITDITFSLSKSFPIPHARVGMRLTRIDDDDPLFVVNKTNYCNRIGAAVGYYMIDRFGPDHIPNTYRDLQHQWCQEIGAEPSHCVIFGMGDERWKVYDRGAGNNRLSFNKYLGKGKLPDALGI